MLMFLVFGLFISHDTEARSKVTLSKKYIPQGNPGGTNFYEDEDFAESYRIYKKRRKVLKKKRLQRQANVYIDKEVLAKRLKEKRIAILSNKPTDIKACIFKDEKDAMVNQYGINIACLKGAVFIDQAQQCEGGQLKSKRQKEKKASTTQEEKIYSINSAIKDTPSKKCSRNYIDDLNHKMNLSLNSSPDSFGMMADIEKK